MAMDTLFLLTLVLLGLGGGFLSGLLGLGGAIFMIPLLLYVPPLLGVGQLDMKEVAAISMVQVLSASLSGLIVHSKNRFVSKSIFLYMGVANAVGNLAGAILSKHTKSAFLLAVFATMALIAAIVMFIPRREHGENVPPEEIEYNKPLATAVSLAIGSFGGMVGAPGAFIYIPVMIYLLNPTTQLGLSGTIYCVISPSEPTIYCGQNHNLRCRVNIPTRIVVGSTLGIVFLGAITGTIGKMATGQIIWPCAIALVLGTVPGAQFGGRVSKKVNTKYLRLAIAVIIAVTGLRMWYQMLTGQ